MEYDNVSYRSDRHFSCSTTLCCIRSERVVDLTTPLCRIWSLSVALGIQHCVVLGLGWLFTQYDTVSYSVAKWLKGGFTQRSKIVLYLKPTLFLH